MSEAATHVAQMNILLMNHPLDDPRMAEFTDSAARANAVAGRSKEGFGRPAAMQSHGPSEAAYDFTYLRHRARLEAE